MSFAVSASATRVVASVRVPVKAQRASAAAAFVAPAAKANSAARLSMRSNATGVALKHAKSTVAAKHPANDTLVTEHAVEQTAIAAEQATNDTLVAEHTI